MGFPAAVPVFVQSTASSAHHSKMAESWSHKIDGAIELLLEAVREVSSPRSERWVEVFSTLSD